MIGALKRLKQVGNRHAGKLFLIGLAGVVWYNWRSWQRDKALLARQPKPEPLPALDDWPQAPLVSVLVAAWNEAGHVGRLMATFEALEYPRREMILCAGGTDGTYDLACGYAGAGITVLEQKPGEGKQRALRRCYAQAKGKIIYLTDADSTLANSSFDRTLHPILEGHEYVVSGDHRPLDRQLTNPMVVHQWFVNRYVAARTPDYVGGLKGANCAMHRDALERVGAFLDDVPVGTDYYLARKLLKGGYRIRYVRDSELQTEYPDNIMDYRREHSRWTRNIINHSLRFGEYRTMMAGLATVCVGSLMFLLPLSVTVIGKAGLVLWGLLYVHAYLSRIRYTVFGQRRTGFQPTGASLAGLAPCILLDFFVWASVAVDLLVPGRRRRW